MCTFLLQNGASWDVILVHCGICATGLLVYIFITVKSYKRYVISNHRQPDCWFNSLLILTRKITSDSASPVLWDRDHRLPVDSLGKGQGVVSLTIPELSKILSRNLCFAEIVLLMWISSWNFVRVPETMLCAHMQSFGLKLPPEIWFLASYIFARSF